MVILSDDKTLLQKTKTVKRTVTQSGNQPASKSGAIFVSVENKTLTLNHSASFSMALNLLIQGLKRKYHKEVQ